MKLSINRFLSGFQRITSGGRFIPEIDGLRFIAIIPVVLAHTNTHFMRVFSDRIPEGWLENGFQQVLSVGGFGVKFFFAISGFILAMPFAKQYGGNGKKVDIKQYFLRRLTRLEPPFIIAIGAIFVMQIVMNLATFKESFPHLLATLTYSHVFIYGYWSTINPVSWSLETEVQFYTLAPLLTMVFFIKRKWLFHAVLAFIVVGFFLTKPGYDWLVEHHLHKSLLSYIVYFLLGFIFARVYLDHSSWLSKKSIVGDVVFLLGMVGLCYFAIQKNYLPFSLSILMCFIGVFKGKFSNKLMTAPIITVIGGMCYTIYLLHYSIIFMSMTMFKKLFSETSDMLFLIIQFTLSFVIVLVISFIFFKLFEQPFMNKHWYKTGFLKFSRKNA